MMFALTVLTFAALPLFTNAYAGIQTAPPLTKTPAFLRPDLQVTWEIELAEIIRQESRQSSRPYSIAVVGIPGSGKSTGAEILASLCGDECLCMPFDGYHYSLDTLRSMPNPADLIYRRGAPDTFDSESLFWDLQRIRDGEECQIFLPGFDHAVGDPQIDCHRFDRNQHKVVVTEGLYLLHDKDGWERIKDCFDMTVYVDADLNVCMERLKIRNQSIPGYTPEEIAIRVDAVDRVNAQIVENTKPHADLVVKSAAFR